MAEQLGEVRTTCPYCGVGCGVVAERLAEGGIRVQGDQRHPANVGRLCSKGAALGETLELDDRLLRPELHGRPVDWDTALNAVSEGFQRVIREHGPQAVAFYVSGQLLTEDYYVANKLMKGFIGSANIDTNSRLCMSSSVVAHKRAFGSDTVPGCYEDLEQADLVVLVGANLAWCHPVLHQRLLAARRSKSASKLVVIDPRRTDSCDNADLHLAVRPGSDTALFNGLLYHLHKDDQVDFNFLENHVEGYWTALNAARENAPTIPAVAAACGLSEEQVAEFYSLFSRTEKTVTLWSQGANQSSYGVDKVNTIINCHLATGRIGRPGMGPFSITGQPNAMGGREVGGLANQLAAHMDFDPESVERVRRFWQAPAMADRPGLKAVELFQAVARGEVKAVWIMATNPAVSMPDADAVRDALRRCELVVVSDVVRDTDTMAMAHVRLPALAWGEKDGTVTNSERRITRQRAFLPPPGEARADWWIIAQVARRMGFATGFDYHGPDQIFREHAALSGVENDGARDFDISALAALDKAAYDNLAPLQWPLGKGGERLFGNGRFFTPGRRARLIAVGERHPANGPDDRFPLVLNTGRVRDHWHTLTRTAKSPRLSAHVPEPYAELHPVDALAFNIRHDGLVRVTSRWGEAIVRAKVNDDQQPGSVFVPMHWGECHALTGRIDAVVNPAVDPLSGQPESKHTPVRIQPYRPAWQGFVLSRRRLDLRDWPTPLSYRVDVRGEGFHRYEIAGEAQVTNLEAALREAVPSSSDAEPLPIQWIDYLDAAAGHYRGAALLDGRLEYCVFIAPDHELPPRSWLAGLFKRPSLDSPERASLLAGRPGRGQEDQGRLVCACFGVGVNTLIKAIRQDGLTSPEQVGAALQAGTNCGSCVPELRKLIAQTQGRHVA